MTIINIIFFLTGFFLGYFTINYCKQYYTLQKLKNNYSEELNNKFSDL